LCVNKSLDLVLFQIKPTMGEENNVRKR